MTALTTSRADLGATASASPRVQLIARLALLVGGLWGIAFAIVNLATTLTPDDKPFRHAADYWSVGLGLPLVISALTLVMCVHSMNDGSDGSRGRWGVALMTVTTAVFSAMFIQSLVQGETSSWGPSYPLCVLISDIALGLFVAGSWRTGVLPRWALLTWWFGWFVGGAFSVGPTSLLLTAAYVVIATQLRSGRRSV